jgi:DNA/RNA-binding domain of Phe-tRNA-synthetase-like protein
VYFQHAREIWADFPELVPGVLAVDGVTSDAEVEERIVRFTGVAEARLGSGTEGELAEIQAWRRAFSKMGLKPTQYRCASEALLRRFRKEGSLPRIHPLIDLCNAVSLAYAIPVAVFDVSEVADHLEVRYARGDETYLTFSGELERPEPREVVFADAAGHAHARRWTNRQSAESAVRASTVSALVVAEALHEAAPADVQRLVAGLGDELRGAGFVILRTAILSRYSPTFELLA